PHRPPTRWGIPIVASGEFSRSLTQGKDKPAEVAEQAAERAERAGSYLKESDGERILRDVEQFARQRPTAVIAGGIALGFAASRFLKASGAARYQQSTERRPPAPQLPPGDGPPTIPAAPPVGYPTRPGAV
ncbi:MAG: hypothetical protein LC790_01695, partial [Actinobacteria bacterium]|nr:hypothetical protein [Actinomycetota bacterium]